MIIPRYSVCRRTKCILREGCDRTKCLKHAPLKIDWKEVQRRMKDEVTL